MPEITSILRTKLHNPLIRSDHVHRFRLIDKLNYNYQSNALTLVSAPAGYGKSYLVSCWLTENKIPFGWISLSEEDNDIRTFLEYFKASIENVSPGSLVKTEKLLKTGHLPPLSEIIHTLLNELDEIEKEFVLVLDDYHHIREKKIHDLINTLLQYPPDNLLLCIISRQDPPLRIGSLRAYNRLNEIRAQDLAFTLQEMSVLYHNINKMDISDEISLKLLARTEGWVTGLRLTALSVNSIEQLEGLLNTIKPDTRLVTDYLVEEVLMLQTEQVQNYLVRTSLLERFCADVIEKLDLTEPNEKDDKLKGVDFITWLENTNLFIIPLDDEHKWFRYHHLFRELLLKQLKRKISPEHLEILYKQAGEWFEENGFIEEGIKYMLAAGEPEKAAEIVEKNTFNAMDKDLWRVLESWLKLLPAALLNHRLNLQISVAWIAKNKYRFTDLFSSLERCKELFSDKPKKDFFFGEWCYLTGFFKLFFEGDISGSLDFLNEALKIFPKKPFSLLRAETELQKTITMLVAGKGVYAEKIINNRIQEIPDKEPFTDRLRFALCTIYILRGDLQGALYNAELLKEDSKRKNNEFVEGWARWFLGTVSLHRFKLDEALHQYTRASELRYASFYRTAIDGLIGLTLTYQMSGQPDIADEKMLFAKDYAEWANNSEYLVLHGSAGARIALLRGNISEAVNWQRSLELEPHYPSIVFFLSNIPITECRVLLAEGTDSSLSLALKKLDNLYKAMKTYNYTYQIIDILVLQSILQQKIGYTQKALEIMKSALEIAVPGMWIRPFIEPGIDVINILNQLIKKNVYTEYCKMLINAFEEYETTLDFGSKSNNTQKSSLIEPLTQREIEILALLSAGLKNREIADRIYLSPTTIKKHVYNIYQKLNVHSRIEVVTKAKKLGLIS